MTSEPVLEAVRAPDDLGMRAYEHVVRLVGFGQRYTGSPGWAKGVDYIAWTLQQTTGRTPVRDRWIDPMHGIEFENVSLTLPGKSPHRLLLACHHDTKKCEGHPDPAHNFYFVGANDSGSGVGLLLALAEHLAREPHEATIELVFFDGEECLDFKWDESKALFGSRRYVARERAREQEARGKIRAMVLLDMVGAKELSIDEDTNSDPELRRIFRAAARASGHERWFFARQQPARDDHVPFLDAGIPAIDLIDLADNPQWHTANDTLEHVSARSLQIVGEVVLTALPAIELAYFPPERLDLPRPK
jgi:hypothetical protein